MTVEMPGASVGGNWTGETTRTGRGFTAEEQEVKITIGEEESRQRQQKDVPVWVRESTVSEEAAVDPSVPSARCAVWDSHCHVAQAEQVAAEDPPAH